MGWCKSRSSPHSARNICARINTVARVQSCATITETLINHLFCLFSVVHLYVFNLIDALKCVFFGFTRIDYTTLQIQNKALISVSLNPYVQMFLPKKEPMENFANSMLQIPDDASFDAFLQANAKRIGDMVNAYLPTGSHPDMDKYLYDPLKAFSENGGKRHRPLICFLACYAVGGDVSLVTSAAAAIEHFQSAALIHDDIADEGELRRGAPCMYLTEGIGLAINTGDLALSTVNGTVVDDPKLPAELKVRVISELIAMTKATIEGQALDLGWVRDGRYDVTVDDYLTMATHKTAYYSGATPLAIGAIIGGANEEVVEALRAYGLATGLAFQIQDDILNLVGTEESTKKDFRNDITEGKRTLMVVHALNHASEKDRNRLIEILSSHETDPEILAEAVDIMEQSGGISFARAYADTLIEKAKPAVIEAVEPTVARDVLLSMGDWFVTRLA